MRLHFPVALAAAAWLSLAGAQTNAPPASVSPPPASAPGAPSTGSEPVQPTIQDDKEVIAASEKWLAVLDAGKFGPAWDTSSAYLKSVVTRKNWIQEIGAARKPLGKFDHRKAEKFARTHSFPGAPEGDYAIVEFDSTFANGKKATEHIVWTLETGDVWRVSGYFIR
jgi:Protein of unknown function (DUF4019)